VEAGEAACHDAVQWCSSLAGHGGTATIDALQVGVMESCFVFVIESSCEANKLRILEDQRSNLIWLVKDQLFNFMRLN